MKILGINPGHDGAVCLLEDGALRFVIEQEKDSCHRFESLRPRTIIKALSLCESGPDVLAVGGWVKFILEQEFKVESGYLGYNSESFIFDELQFLGRNLKYFSSPHERSHILCSYGLSPFKQGAPCYVLNWEGTVGAFYEIDEKVNVKKIADIMDQPGAKYQFIYHLADNGECDDYSLGLAGKVMALTGFYDGSPLTNHGQELLELLVSKKAFWELKKKDLEQSPFYRIGVESQEFKNLAYHFSELIFNKFFTFAKSNLTRGWPLLISGGCGLNCEWNSRWRQSGLFEDVFVPPCTNDTGSALGTAIDAQLQFTGSAKVAWNVYCGEEFILDIEKDANFTIEPLAYSDVANFLADDKIIAWVQGRYEIGPRALGNRSLLASPFHAATHARLNKIKHREGFRPIAPICLEESVGDLFEPNWPSPYMLYFQRVKDQSLRAITHVDGSARVQTVTERQNHRAFLLLSAFKEQTGFGVLCNTSLNFNGRGFINRMSDLVKLANDRELDGMVVGDLFWKRR